MSRSAKFDFCRNSSTVEAFIEFGNWCEKQYDAIYFMHTCYVYRSRSSWNVTSIGMKTYVISVSLWTYPCLLEPNCTTPKQPVARAWSEIHCTYLFAQWSTYSMYKQLSDERKDRAVAQYIQILFSMILYVGSWYRTLKYCFVIPTL